MYAEKRQKQNDALSNEIKTAERQAQKNLNSRLDRMRFRNYTRAEFTSTAPHPSTDISFVTESDSSISLYKGDTKLSSEGSGVDVKYAALVGYGTGIGGERTGQGEIENLRNGSRENIANGDALGSYTKQISYWVDSHGEGYSQYLTNKTLDVHGKGDFASSTSDSSKATCILINRSKALVHPGVRDNYYSYTNQYPIPNFSVSMKGPKGDLTVNVRHKNSSNSWGSRESIRFTMEIAGMQPNGSSVTRVCTDLVPQYKIKVTKGASSRYLDGKFLGGFFGTSTSSIDTFFDGSGVLIGCEDIVTSTHLVYGQIKNPGLLWVRNGYVYTIPETSDNPYGFFYDISTGNPLSEPTLEFYNSNERILASILWLDRSEYV